MNYKFRIDSFIESIALLVEKNCLYVEFIFFQTCYIILLRFNRIKIVLLSLHNFLQ